MTLDGTSLTLTHVNDAERSFGIMLISHSQEIVTLTSKEIGDTVNVEVDCVGKYLLKGMGEGGVEAMVERLVERKLKERGI